MVYDAVVGTNYRIKERGGYTLFIRLTEKAEKALAFSQECAVNLGHNYVGTEHILYGLVKEGSGIAAKVLNSLGVTEENVLKYIEEMIPKGKDSDQGAKGYTPRAKNIFQISASEAAAMGSKFISTEHLLLGIIKEGDSFAVAILKNLGADIQKIAGGIASMLNEESAGSSPGGDQKAAAQSQQATPVLNQYGRDLTEMAKAGKLDPVIGREKEIERVVQILSRRTKNNPCLIGEPGVGKTAITEGLAQKIVDGNIPETIKGKRVVTLDLSGMVAGAKYRGEFEDRLKKAVDEIRKAGNVILFIDEMHTIIGAGAAEGAIDASNILKPLLARGEMQVIGATTLNEYRKYVEKDAALERRFQPIMVGEPTEDETYEILKGLRDKYEAHHRVKITDSALEAAVKLSGRYIADRFLPDKAIDLIDEAASKVRIKAFTAPPDLKDLEKKAEKLNKEKEDAIKCQEFEKAAKIRDEEKSVKNELAEMKKSWDQDHKIKTEEVNEDDIADIVSSWTGIPVRKLAEEEAVRLMNLEAELHKRVIGQDEAVKAVSKAIRRGRVGLKDPKRPVGSFIFLGPTGVGKTELSKALAEALFGDENSIIRIDMSEYMEKHNVSRLVGSPPGYVGYEEGGQLTEKVRRKPYSVILFDEIEKAHPDVFNMLLQILDDGRLTDSQGRAVSFKNSVIIMTSNVGARMIIEPKTVGFATDESNSERTYEHMKNSVLGELKRTFRPEFLNRVDDIIVFHALDEEEVRTIARLMAGVLAKRLETNNISMEVTEGAINFLARSGFDPTFGARPLKRTIQNMIEDRLAEEMLEGKVKPGDNIIVDFAEEKIIITRKA